MDFSRIYARVRAAFDTSHDAIQAETFDQWRSVFAIRRLRLALLIILFGNLAFLVMDFVLHPQEFANLVKSRAVLSAAIVPVVGLLFVPAISRWPRLAMLSGGIGINYLLASSHVFDVYAAVTMFDIFAVSSYYLGLTLAILVVTLLVPVYLGTHLFTQALIVGFYALHYREVGIFPGEREALFNDAFHSLWIWVVGDILIFIQGRMLRSEFDARRMLESTNRKLGDAYAKLSELDRMKGDFFANVSHELRTPLTLILGSLQSIAGRLPSPDLSKAVDVGIRNASRLLVMINELLDLARFDSGRAAPKKKDVDVARLVREVAANFDSSGTDREIVVTGAQDPVAATIDARQVKKVLYNLLSNAMKFTDPMDGRIEVALRNLADTIELEVRDNGQGMHKDELEKIFDRFSQAESHASTSVEGTGIGLALVKEIVDAHSGSIDVDSHPGAGTRFCITLPRGDAEVHRLADVSDGEAEMLDDLYRAGRHAAAPDDSAITEAGSQQLADDAAEVLVVEDNPDLRQYIAQILARRYRVSTAVDGADGLRQVLERTPDLVVTDLMMPNMTGNVLLQKIRADDRPETSGTPVIILTAQAATEARIDALSSGADDYLGKPFHEGELLARVENLLRARAQERQLADLNSRLQDRVEKQMAELVRSGGLKNFLPRDIAERIIDGDIDPDKPLERQRITALFADLVGYTELTSQLEPEEAAAILNEYLSELTATTVEFGGFVDKFVGDAVMSVFGPPSLPDPVLQAAAAADAALRMQSTVDRMSDEWRRRGVPRDLKLRVGLHTGFVTIGVFGSDLMRTYTAVGTPVNIASRLQAEADPGDVICGDTTYALLEDTFQFDPLGSRTLRGINHEIESYRVIGRTGDLQDRD